MKAEARRQTDAGPREMGGHCTRARRSFTGPLSCAMTQSLMKREGSGHTRRAAHWKTRKEGPWTKGELERQLPRTAERAFDPERKRSPTTVHRIETGTVSYTKGAPDVILETVQPVPVGRCGERPLSDRQQQKKAPGPDLMAFRPGSSGCRGRARSDGDGRKEQADLVFLGLGRAMADPPRSGGGRPCGGHV